MPQINGFNVGKDYNAFLFDTNSNAIVSLGIVEDIKIAAQKHDVPVRPYNGAPLFGFVPDGYKGTITIARSVSVLEDLMIGQEIAFNNGQSNFPGYIQETWTNQPGLGVSVYQYTGVVFYLTERVDVKREGKVIQKLEWMASTKIPVG